ncbi:hypothetical protein [Cupriavidus sp. DL-D2]|uniref:hypothetical protein n=1 Tax=Cupriavidus sp. DL-D2 TaxID=3144974 RepID=UPI00321568C9
MDALHVVIAALVATFTIGIIVGWMVRGFAETAKSDASGEVERYDIRQPDERHEWRSNSAKAPRVE